MMTKRVVKSKQRVDLFTRKEYRDIIVDALNYSIKEKHLTVYGWVIMSNHIHLACQCKPPGKMSDFLRDFKKYISKRIMQEMDIINESREDWLKDIFSYQARRTGRAKNFKIWTDDNHAIDLTDIDIIAKLDYIHENPVRARLVNNPDDYVYSSAMDYAGKKGPINIEIV